MLLEDPLCPQGRNPNMGFNPSYTGYATGSCETVVKHFEINGVSILLILDMLLEAVSKHTALTTT